MSQYVVDGRVVNGRLHLQNIPMNNDTDVKVIVIPKADLSKMSFRAVQDLTKPITGKLSDDISEERAE